MGLAVHAGVVFVRGVLPVVLATTSACLLWRRRRGSEMAPSLTLALSLVVAALATRLILTPSIAGWPRLEIARALDAVATVALLGAAATASELLVRLRRPRLR